MGLLDRILGRSDNTSKEASVQPVGNTPTSAIISRAIAERECNLSKCKCIPVTPPHRAEL